MRPGGRALKGAKPGLIIAVRSELDALPVRVRFRLSPRCARPITSRRSVAHACGHDIHIAATLGLASVLASMREQLPGTVIFVFQPAEEGPPEGEEGGAALMLKEGIFSKLKP